MNDESIFKRLKGIKGIGIILCGGVIGVLLIVFGTLYGGSPAEKKELAGGGISAYTEYAAYLEKKLGEQIAPLTGGVYSVMITLEGGEETVCARDTTGEERREYVVVRSSSSGEQAIPLKLLAPDVMGVSVVCAGGGSASVRSEIIAMACALFNIPSTRVYVGGIGQ
ncbi:MAG: hypothetical protein WCQ72_07480 [Eubacteriales bacterium]